MSRIVRDYRGVVEFLPVKQKTIQDKERKLWKIERLLLFRDAELL